VKELEAEAERSGAPHHPNSRSGSHPARTGSPRKRSSCILFPRPRKPGSTNKMRLQTVTELNLLATTGRRARFLTAFENYGQVLKARAGEDRYFDLRPSLVFSALAVDRSK
jgi:hypothetical protein